MCKSEADSIRTYGLTNPIAVIPNGVELPAVELDPPAAASKEKRQLLFLGRIHPKKGLDELIVGWAKAKSENPKAFSSWQLLIAGWDDGGHVAGLKKLACKNGLLWSDNIRESSDPIGRFSSAADICFVGPCFGDDKDQLLRSVDAFVLPSFSEGLPMSVLEAWSYGLPVLMTEFCNIPEGFTAGAAVEIDPNAASISEGLIQMTTMPASVLTDYGVKGRALVESRFTWERIAEEMMTVYAWCMDGGTPPECIMLSESL